MYIVKGMNPRIDFPFNIFTLVTQFPKRVKIKTIYNDLVRDIFNKVQYQGGHIILP